MFKSKGNKRQVDPARYFGDKFAGQTGWYPVKGGGTNFRTHKLVNVRYDRMEFRTSLVNLLFSLIFVLTGAGVAVTAFLSGHQPGGVLAGFVFLSAGGAMLYFGSLPVVFDKRKGFFWKGRKIPYESANWKKTKYCVRLREVYALQLIPEWVTGGEGRWYYSYELNLVLRDGSRINVVDHGSKRIIQKDAVTLSRFLNKPLWDAIDISIKRDHKETEVDPSQFNDPLATKIDWSSASSAEGGLKLTQTCLPVDGNPNRLEFRTSKASFLSVALLILFFIFFVYLSKDCITGIFIVSIAILLALWASLFPSAPIDILAVILVIILLPIVFIVLRCFYRILTSIYYAMRASSVFDKDNGMFYKGKDPVFTGENTEYCARLRDIHALQLLSEQHYRNPQKPPYYHSQLNLVMKDGKRILVAYAFNNDRRKMQKQATVLTDFLNVPLWNATK